MKANGRSAEVSAFQRMKAKTELGTQDAVAATCSVCGRMHHVVTGKGQMADGLVVARFRAEGWTVAKDGTHATCPECTGGVVKLPPPPKPPEPQPSAAAMAGYRAVFSALEEGYDDKAKHYRPHWSDRRVAELAGMSEQAVAQIREKAYGPIQDPAIAEIGEAVEEMRAKIDRDIDELLKRAAEVQADCKAKIDVLSDRVAKAGG